MPPSQRPFQDGKGINFMKGGSESADAFGFILNSDDPLRMVPDALGRRFGERPGANLGPDLFQLFPVRKGFVLS